MIGGIYTLTTLELHVTDTKLISAQLMEMTRKAPHFFDQTAIVLSFVSLEYPDTINLQHYRHLLNKHGMILVAIRGGNQKLKQEAVMTGIAWLPPAHTSTSAKNTNVIMMNQQNCLKPIVPPIEEKPIHKTKFIEQTVRSGQQVHSHGDLIVAGSVSSGAELLAEGNIHVYGSLRGRALAGINGDTNARIFCRQFEAELISIGGQYKVPSSSTPRDTLWGASVQVHFDKKSLHILKL